MRTTLFLLTVACTDGATPCADRDPTDCGSGCVAEDGRPIVDNGTDPACYEAAEPLFCLDEDVGCGDAETFAAPAADPSDCHWFSSTCVPEGWGACSVDYYGVGVPEDEC